MKLRQGCGTGDRTTFTWEKEPCEESVRSFIRVLPVRTKNPTNIRSPEADACFRSRAVDNGSFPGVPLHANTAGGTANGLPSFGRASSMGHWCGLEMF